MTTTTLLLLSVLAAGGKVEADVEADYVIRGAEIHDGSGAEGRVGDVAIRADRIVAVGSFQVSGTPRVIDGSGLVVAPGFIDLHNHSDRSITQPGTRNNVNYRMQGVTSIVTGNCGSGPVDVGGYLDQIGRQGAGTNVLHLIPHGSLRRQVMATAGRAATAEELQAMKRLVDQGMRQGAWGMSTGLIYVPGSFATTDELVELARVVAGHGGLYASHMRNEGTRLLEAIAETLEIGRRAEVPVHISHFKVSGRPAWGQAADAIGKVQQAREAGQVVTADQYPYTASSTSLAAMVLPSTYRSQNRLAAALEDPQQATQVRAAIQRMLDQRGGGKSLYVASYSHNRHWQGKDLLTLAQQQDRPVIELVLEIQRRGGAQMVNFGMSEEEVRLIMQQPFVATASDGSARRLQDGSLPHPRSYGCFPRKIGHYALQGQVVSLAQAIRSASGLPADILGLPERGYVRQGDYADLVLFDPDSFLDTATFDKPHQYATGVRYLFVNGVLTVSDGQPTDALPGKPLRRG